ncbi:MAG TPA: flagellar hook-associated protein FlgK [Edaphobacter sp.]
MGTLGSAMTLARQALMNDQAALNVVSNNVANQNTAGYTRQVASWQENDSIRIGSYNVGQGATETQSSQRDRVLEQRVQQQTQTQSQSAAVQSALQQIENIFGLSSTDSSASTTALGKSLSDFYDALSSLTANPSDSTLRQKVISMAQNLVGTFNSASNQMSQITGNLNQQVSTDVDAVNGLLTNIANLNQKIATLSPNADAGALEDQRQLYISQLSQYVGLDQISIENNQISLTTTSGALLVSGNTAYKMGTTTVAGKTRVMAGNPPSDVTSSLSGGDLGGTIEARDTLLPQYQNTLDELAYQVADQFNTVNAGGLDGNGNPGGAIFDIPPTATGAAAQIALATTDPKAIAAAATGEGSNGATNAQKLADLGTSATVSGETPSDFLTSLLGTIGSDTASASSDNTTQQAVLSQLTSQRNSLSGVSMDEEAANLTQYQRSYEAAAKVFSIVNQMMADAINLGVTTAVS